jgi:aryl-alcohol dehydrogenase-like predicted oxidoreductase
MGIAGNYGLDSDDIRWAAEQGANYWLWGASFRKIKDGLREVIQKDREKHVIAMLGMGFFGWQVRKSVEKALRQLNTDYLDVFKLGWLGKTSRYSQGIIDTLLKLKEEGKIKTIGASIHDRQRAGKLALDSDLDVFMIRYNAKHPGAEIDIFPHLAKRDPAIVAYTAVAWRQLIRPVKGIEMPPWPGESSEKMPPLTPDLCYRFVLTNPHVHLVLTGPRSREELAQNLASLERGPLSDEQMTWIRAYGKKLKEKRKLDYV